ncbi:MAG: hypothetical protein AB1585_15605 [Thermodesulfobacteriota bacterium]
MEMIMKKFLFIFSQVKNKGGKSQGQEEKFEGHRRPWGSKSNRGRSCRSCLTINDQWVNKDHAQISQIRLPGSFAPCNGAGN